MSLYTIMYEIENFEFEVDEETGEVVNFDKLDELEVERDTKIENIGLYIKNLDAESKMIREEEKCLAERRRVKENKMESLKKYLMDCLDGQKFETSKLKISYRKSQRVECPDYTIVPLEYIKLKDPEVDKVAVKEALKKGISVNGCQLIENTSIVIK